MCGLVCSCGCGVVPVHTGDVLNVHTGERRGRSSSVLLTKFCPRRFSHAPEVQKRNPWMLPIFSLRIGREQHVAESSFYSLHLNTLFNSRHMTQRHTQTRTHTTQRHTATHHTAQNTPQHRSKERGAPASSEARRSHGPWAHNLW